MDLKTTKENKSYLFLFALMKIGRKRENIVNYFPPHLQFMREKNILPMIRSANDHCPRIGWQRKLDE